MTYLAIPAETARQIEGDLLGAAPLEAGAFCRLRAVSGDGSIRLVLGAPIESPEPWVAQRRDLLTPSGRRISAAVSVAASEGSGLAFVHSHPNSTSAALSSLDRETTARLGQTFSELIDGPFASLVVSRSSWGGVTTNGELLDEIDRLAITGRDLQLHGAPRADLDEGLDDRQVRAMGEGAQRLLRSLRVGIVGAGGLGSPIAETLVRMGVGEIRLVDHDQLDTLSNARRVFGVARQDIDSSSPRDKAQVVAGSLNALGLGGEVIPIVGDVRDSATQAQLVDVDLLVSGTDTHSSRAALSEFAMRAALPLIDVGVRVGVRGDRQLDALRLERRLQVPGGPCLWCWQTLDAEQVRLELMPETDRRQLAREGYVAGLPDGPTPSVGALTVTAAGIAASAVVGMVCGALDTAPLGVGLDALTLESDPFSRRTPDPACICSRWR